MLDLGELGPSRENLVGLLFDPGPRRRNGIEQDGLDSPRGLAVGIDLGEPPNRVGLAGRIFHGFFSLPGHWYLYHSLPTFLL